MLTHQIARNCMVMLLLAIAAGLSLLPGDNAEAQEDESGLVGHWFVQPDALPAFGRRSQCLLWIDRDQDVLSGALSCDGYSLQTDLYVVADEGNSFVVSNGVGYAALIFIGSVTGEPRMLSGEWFVSAPRIDGRWSGTFSATPYPTGWGNLNCDGTVSSLDALLMLQSNFGVPCFAPAGQLHLEVPNYGVLGADVNLDGKKDSKDALLILQVEAGLIERLPIRSQ